MFLFLSLSKAFAKVYATVAYVFQVLRTPLLESLNLQKSALDRSNILSIHYLMRLRKYQAHTSYVARILRAVQTPPLDSSILQSQH